MSDLYHSIYTKLEKIGVLEVRQYAVIENNPHVPLCIDRLSDDMFALSQNPVIEGVLVADPDIEIKVYHDQKRAEPLVYQDRLVRKIVYPRAGVVDLGVKNELMEFLDRWLTDLIEQGFIRNQ
ncbi:MAG: hypothetical protein APR55_01810 [Methanolinea sp. SDB]|nr:MAG: hypothetical protein APR55_01810 [Methanolinea sp. SDB]